MDALPVVGVPVEDVAVDERDHTVERGAVVRRTTVGLGPDERHDHRVEALLGPGVEIPPGLRRGEVDEQRPGRVARDEQRLSRLVDEVAAIVTHGGHER